MRLVVKAALVLFVLYLAFVGGLAYWMERSVRSLSRSMLRNTARLVGSDIAAVISKSAIEELRLGDPAARERLEQTMEDITSRSEVVSSVSVVDIGGRVVASDEMEVGRQVADPDLIFPPEGHSEFGAPRLVFQRDAYYLFVPLLDQKKIVGYLRLGLNSEPFAVVYSRARRDFVLLGLAGLGGIALLLLLLRAALSRRATQLLDTLAGPAAYLPIDDASFSDELASVQNAARRLARRAQLADRQALQLKQRFEALQRSVPLGVLVLNPDRTLGFANQEARDLIGCSVTGELEARWNEVQALIEDAWEESVADEHRTRFTIELADMRPPRVLELVAVELDEDGRSHGHLLLVSDKALRAALEADLCAAQDLRALQPVCAAAAATVGELADDIDANLQGLRAALERDGVQAGSRLHEQQTEYVDTIDDDVAGLADLCRKLLAQLQQRQIPRPAFDLRDLITDVLTLSAGVAQRKQIVFEAAELSSPIILAIGYRRLRDALLNVCLHMVEWMPAGGSITIEVQRNPTQLSLVLRCATLLPAPIESPQMFTAYLRDEQGGARCGLRVAQNAVEDLGGEIEVYATAGGGTCYRLTVPLAGRSLAGDSERAVS